jgi:diaminohydroxyphosphoribosylaminopyrimidine deaminase/5-amino-6-(5-phosphoribosylamino)uracil reductase
MGIMVGINTLIADNPRLNARIENGVDPYRIVVDPRLRTPEDYNFVRNNKDNKSIILTSRKNLETPKQKLFEKKYNIKFIYLDGIRFLMKDILREIGQLGIDSVLLEGGHSLISASFNEEVLDGGEIFIAPKIVGDKDAITFLEGRDISKMRDTINLKDVKYKTYGDNICVKFKC